MLILLAIKKLYSFFLSTPPTSPTSPTHPPIHTPYLSLSFSDPAECRKLPSPSTTAHCGWGSARAPDLQAVPPQPGYLPPAASTAVGFVRLRVAQPGEKQLSGLSRFWPTPAGDIV